MGVTLKACYASYIHASYIHLAQQQGKFPFQVFLHFCTLVTGVTHIIRIPTCCETYLDVAKTESQ